MSEIDPTLSQVKESNKMRKQERINQTTTQKGISRRKFFYVIGGATGAVIGGWLLTPQVGKPFPGRAKAGPTPTGPGLTDGLVIKPTRDGAEIYRTTGADSAEPICMVNEVGRYVLDEMDGKKPVSELAKAVMARLEAPPSDLEAFSSQIASFIADLGDANLLDRPFFVNIYRSEITA